MKNTYSLWLIPTGEAYNQFAEIISRLSAKHHSPKFEPHVTLIGAIIGTEEELSAKIAQLAKLIKPFKIKLGIMDYFNERHKALLVRAEKTPELIEANKITREVFDLPPDPEYMPHLSLLYGDFSPETKEEIIKELGREFNIEFKSKGVCLYFTTGEEDENNWHKIKDFPFKGGT